MGRREVMRKIIVCLPVIVILTFLMNFPIGKSYETGSGTDLIAAELNEQKTTIPKEKLEEIKKEILREIRKDELCSRKNCVSVAIGKGSGSVYSFPVGTIVTSVLKPDEFFCVVERKTDWAYAEGQKIPESKYRLLAEKYGKALQLPDLRNAQDGFYYYIKIN